MKTQLLHAYKQICKFIQEHSLQRINLIGIASYNHIYKYKKFVYFVINFFRILGVAKNINTFLAWFYYDVWLFCFVRVQVFHQKSSSDQKTTTELVFIA